jgi:hypothetical protein
MPRDRRRDPKKEKFWRRLVQRQAVSRLSVRAWCHRHGRKESAFYWWRSELARRDGVQPRRKPRPTSSFVPIRIAAASGATESSSAESRIEIVLSGQRRVQVSGRVDRSMLADVLAVLEHGDGPAESRPC